MPPSGYLSAAGVEACINYIASAYPSITQLITLPQQSIEGRTSRALKIASGSGSDRKGVLLIGGVHARELVNPDLLVNLALRMCHSYTIGSNITYGGKTWTSGVVDLLVDNLDIYVYPLVNPDGRAWVQSPAGYAMWRKNRRVNAGSSYRGVDLNRNYDFLWSSGIGTSSSTSSDVYKGTSAFSEPEVKNVKWMLDSHSNIDCFMDVHSYSELVLYPWGDDDNQSATPSQTFTNSSWDGLRGVLGSGYAEYIGSGDASKYQRIGEQIRDAIQAVRGRTYTVQEASDLYPTSGTSEDYVYSRHINSPGRPKAMGYTLETGTQFQPPIAEANEVIKEASSGIIQFLVACICLVETSDAGLSTAQLDRMRDFRDTRVVASARGRSLVAGMEANSAMILSVLRDDEEAGDALRQLAKAAADLSEDPNREIDERTKEHARTLFDAVRDRGDEQMVELVEEMASILDRDEGITPNRILEDLAKAKSTRKGKKAK